MIQPTLFDDRIARAANTRDSALVSVEANADAQWKADAWDWLVQYLRTHAEFFPDEACVSAPQPREKRAWGALVKRAVTAGLLERAGFRARASGNLTPATVWRSLVWENG